MLIIKVFEIYARGSNYPLQKPTLAQLSFAVPRLSTGYLPNYAVIMIPLMLPVLASHICSTNLMLGTVCIRNRAAVNRDVTPCSLRGIYIHSGGTLRSCLGYLTNGDSTFLLNVIKFLPDSTVSQKRQQFSKSPSRVPEI
jgi:hypothetical protein